jgi:hypothetical protein
MHSVCGTQCACPTKSPKLLKKEFLLRQTVPDVHEQQESAVACPISAGDLLG